MRHGGQAGREQHAYFNSCDPAVEEQSKTMNHGSVYIFEGSKIGCINAGISYLLVKIIQKAQRSFVTYLYMTK